MEGGFKRLLGHRWELSQCEYHSALGMAATAVWNEREFGRSFYILQNDVFLILKKKKLIEPSNSFGSPVGLSIQSVWSQFNLFLGQLTELDQNCDRLTIRPTGLVFKIMVPTYMKCNCEKTMEWLESKHTKGWHVREIMGWCHLLTGSCGFTKDNSFICNRSIGNKRRLDQWKPKTI